MKIKYILIIFSISVFFACNKDIDLDTHKDIEETAYRIKSVKKFDNGLFNRRNEYIYNENGKLTSVESFTINSTGIENKNTDYKIEYSENKIIRYVNENWRLSLVPRIDNVLFNSKYEIEVENNHVAKIENYSLESNEWILNHRTAYIYNGEKLLRWNGIYLGGEREGISEGEYVYSGDTLVQRFSSSFGYFYYNNKWGKSGYYSKKEYIYKNGQLNSIFYFNKNREDEDWLFSKRIEYQYSENVVKKIHYSPSENSFIQGETESEIKTYNENGYVISTKKEYSGGSFYEDERFYEKGFGNADLVFFEP